MKENKEKIISQFKLSEIDHCTLTQHTNLCIIFNMLWGVENTLSRCSRRTGLTRAGERDGGDESRDGNDEDDPDDEGVPPSMSSDKEPIQRSNAM